MRYIEEVLMSMLGEESANSILPFMFLDFGLQSYNFIFRICGFSTELAFKSVFDFVWINILELSIDLVPTN